MTDIVPTPIYLSKAFQGDDSKPLITTLEVDEHFQDLREPSSPAFLTGLK